MGRGSKTSRTYGTLFTVDDKNNSFRCKSFEKLSEKSDKVKTVGMTTDAGKWRRKVGEENTKNWG